MPLLVDTTSAATRLSDRELLAWGKDRGVFVSSVMDELSGERRALAEGLKELGMRPILFEDFGGRDDSAETAYLSGVAQADVYVGLVADRYGTMLESGRSPTHEEYRSAQELGRKVSVWAKEPGDGRQGDARDFLAEVQQFHTTGRFRDAESLVQGVRGRLVEIAADDESPWVKLGDAIFRVESLRDDGEQVFLAAEVRNNDVARYLEGLRPDQWNQRSEVALTTGDNSGVASIQSIATETRSKSLRRLEIVVGIDWKARSSSAMAFGMESYSAQDLAAVCLESGLLCANLPPDLQRAAPFHGTLDVSDPFRELSQFDLPEDSMRSIAILPLVDRLVGGGLASHIDRFELGPLVRGTRQVRLAYTDAKQYANEDPESRTIEGSRPWGP